MLEYLDDHGLRRLSKRLVSSGTLDVVATAVPGIKDILVLGKVKQLEAMSAAGAAGTPDFIVVDAPAAGHAVTFLASAYGLLDAAAVGPIRTQALDVIGLLGDPARCQVMLVTLPEETPVNEAAETAFHLEDRAGVQLAPIVVNCLWPHLDLPLDAAGAVGRDRGGVGRVRARQPGPGRRLPPSTPGAAGGAGGPVGRPVAVAAAAAAVPVHHRARTRGRGDPR